jgi:hypothetical protein
VNRWLRGGLALAVGFGSTWVIIELADNSAAEPDRAGERLGSLSMIDYCRHEFGERSTAVHPTPGAYGWRCWTEKNKILDPTEIDADDACAVLYGAPAYGRSVDDSSAYGWVCFRGPVPQDG